MKVTLANSIEKFPFIYDELSTIQSYMIFSNRTKCIGGICIENSPNEKNLKIEVQLIEEKFEDKESILIILDEIVTNLGYYCFDKEKIEIYFLNNLDLDNINESIFYRYQKCLLKNITCYIIANKYYNKLFSKLIDEISKTEQNLINWKNVGYKDLTYVDFMILY